jgi:DNA-binding NarL/FixJ family response regulator
MSKGNGASTGEYDRDLEPAGKQALNHGAGASAAGVWGNGSLSLSDAVGEQTRKGHGRRTRILVSVAPADEREALVSALAHFPQFDVRVISGLDYAEISDAHHTDYLIVWFETIQKLRETDANAFVKLSRHARVIVALNSDRLLEAASALHLADAWLFTDLVLHQIGRLVGLSGSGYTIVPSGVGNDFGLDNLRLRLLEKLDEEERKVLDELGVGNSNRDIALRLKISEPQTKALVRNILGKLHFRNRTEAAVFIARRRNDIQRAGTVPVL